MFISIKRRWKRVVRKFHLSKELLTFLGVALTIPFWFHSCGAPRMDVNTHEGRMAIISATQMALSEENCTKAIEHIEPLYNSSYVDNEVRMLRASAHACAAGVNFFRTLSDLLTESANLNGSAFFSTVTKVFPSNFEDDKMRSTWFAEDALMAVLNEGVTVPEIYSNGSGNNVGSVIARNRTTNSNALMAFVSMANIGTTQHRYGFSNPKEPNSNYLQEQSLPWTTSTLMTEEGCAYAGSFMHMLESFQELTLSNAKIQAVATSIGSIKGALGTACEWGCTGANGSGCGLTAAECTPVGDCSNPLNVGACDVPCPYAMRSRDRCMDSEAARCAAAGLINYINSATGWENI